MAGTMPAGGSGMQPMGVPARGADVLQADSIFGQTAPPEEAPISAAETARSKPGKQAALTIVVTP